MSNADKMKWMVFVSKVNGRHRRLQFHWVCKIRLFASFQDAQTLNHAFVSTRLDYSSSLFLGLFQRSIDHLQLTESTAETVLAGCRNFFIRTFAIFWLVFTSLLFLVESILQSCRHRSSLAPSVLRVLFAA